MLVSTRTGQDEGLVASRCHAGRFLPPTWWRRMAAGRCGTARHKQALAYRIRGIEQLTGPGIAKTEHLAEWWRALGALDGRAPRHSAGCGVRPGAGQDASLNRHICCMSPFTHVLNVQKLSRHWEKRVDLFTTRTVPFPAFTRNHC